MTLKTKCLSAFWSLFIILGFTNPVEKQCEYPKTVKAFALRNIDNKMVGLEQYKNAKGFIVIFTCNHCPFAKLYTKRLNQLNRKYMKKGVPLLAVNTMDSLLYKEETFEMMQEMAKKEKYNFPYLQDATQAVGKDFNAEHTPKAYVIWKEENSWVIKYEGAIDNDGENPRKAKSYIAEATDQLLKGQLVTLPKTESFGCRIFYRK